MWMNLLRNWQYLGEERREDSIDLIETCLKQLAARLTAGRADTADPVQVDLLANSFIVPMKTGDMGLKKKLMVEEVNNIKNFYTL